MIFEGSNEVWGGRLGRGGVPWLAEDFRSLKRNEGKEERVGQEERRKVTGWKVTK